MSKTIKQIADELGVSKQAVHQKRKREPLSTALQPFTSTVDGVVYISVDGEKLILQAFSSEGVNETVNETVNEKPEVDGLVYALQSTLEGLREQLAVKDRQIEQQGHTIENLSAALAAAQQTAAAAQALHAGTMQQSRESLPPITGEPLNVQQVEVSKVGRRRNWFRRLFD